MARILRGEIRWADLSPVRGHEQSGQRPVLVLSHDVFNERSGTVIGVALASREPRAGYPLTLELADAKLPKRSWVKISQVRTLSVERLGNKIGSASAEELVQIIEGLSEKNRATPAIKNVLAVSSMATASSLLNGGVSSIIST